MIISQNMLCNVMFVYLSLINPFFNSFGCNQSINCDIFDLLWTMDSCCRLFIYLYVYELELKGMATGREYFQYFFGQNNKGSKLRHAIVWVILHVFRFNELKAITILYNLCYNHNRNDIINAWYSRDKSILNNFLGQDSSRVRI